MSSLKLPNMDKHELQYIWDNKFGIHTWNFILLGWAKWIISVYINCLTPPCVRESNSGNRLREDREIHSSVHMVFSSFCIIFNLTSNFQGLSCEVLLEMDITGLFTRSNNIFQHVACELVKWVVCCIFPACIISGYVVGQSKWQGDEIA